MCLSCVCVCVCARFLGAHWCVSLVGGRGPEESRWKKRWTHGGVRAQRCTFCRPVTSKEREREREHPFLYGGAICRLVLTHSQVAQIVSSKVLQYPPFKFAGLKQCKTANGWAGCQQMDLVCTSLDSMVQCSCVCTF